MRHAPARAAALVASAMLLLLGSSSALAADPALATCRISAGGQPIADAAAIRPLAGSAEATGSSPPAIRLPAADLRVTLGRLLAEHTFLSMDAMRATALSGADTAAITDALSDNSTQLADLIGSVYGAPARAEFDRLWRGHVDQLLAYAAGLARNDTAAAQAAKQELSRYLTEFVTFLAGANPHIDGSLEAVALQLHVNQLLAFADSDYRRAFEVGRDAYRHMFEMGDDLARAIAAQFPATFPGGEVAFSPAAELRVNLGALLGEHLVLSAQAMRAGIQHSPDAQDGSAALDANSGDLAHAVGTLYGPGGADAFHAVWARHIAAYLGYVDAIGRGDEAARQASLTTLRAYPTQIADFLASANPKLDRSATQLMLQHHVEALINQTDAFASADYPRSIAIVREAFAHMFTVGDALAAAIVAQFPKRFRDIKELPNTSTVVQPRGAGGTVWAISLGAAVLGFALSVSPGRRRRTGRESLRTAVRQPPQSGSTDSPQARTR